CLTRENQTAPWLNFEAGAIATFAQSIFDKEEKIESRVCPYRIDLEQAEVGWPLAMFQGVAAGRDGTKEIVQMVNRRALAPLSEADLDETFSHFWPAFQKQLDAARNLVRTPIPKRSRTEEMLDEVLSTVRRIERQGVEAESRASLFPTYAPAGSPPGLGLGAMPPSYSPLGIGPISVPDYLSGATSPRSFVLTPVEPLTEEQLK